jgi:RNA polymerase sigma-70 factor (ECF subfamily)
VLGAAPPKSTGSVQGGAVGAKDAAGAPNGGNWSEIAEHYYQHVYRVAYRLVGNRADAEDLTQETFCKVFRALETYRPDGSFEGWLTRITTNLFLDGKRREARVRLEELHDDDSQLQAPEAGPESLIEAVNANAQLTEVLGQLNPSLRKALVMCDVEGCSYQEIADELGVALGTVRSRLHRARAQARAAIGSRV